MTREFYSSPPGMAGAGQGVAHYKTPHPPAAGLLTAAAMEADGLSITPVAVLQGWRHKY